MPPSRRSTPSPGHTDTRGSGTDRAASQRTRRQPSPPLDASAEVRTSCAARSIRRHPRLHAPPAGDARGVPEVAATLVNAASGGAAPPADGAAAPLASPPPAGSPRSFDQSWPGVPHTPCQRPIPCFFWNLAVRAIFARSTGVPIMGSAMTFLDRGPNDRRHLRSEHRVGEDTKGHLYQRGSICWFQFYQDGQRQRITSESTDEAVARRMLKEHEARVTLKEPLVAQTSRACGRRPVRRRDSPGRSCTIFGEAESETSSGRGCPSAS